MTGWKKRKIADAQHIHSCGYFCERPECIKAQRDELRDRLEQQEPTRSQKMRDAGHTRRPKGWDKDGDEPEQPFGWLYSLIVEGQVVNEKFTGVNWDTKYEPFGRYDVDHGGEVTKTPLYTISPQRKPLTNEEIKDVAASCMWWVREQDILDDAIELARAIEAAHGIKENT